VCKRLSRFVFSRERERQRCLIFSRRFTLEDPEDWERFSGCFSCLHVVAKETLYLSLCPIGLLFCKMYDYFAGRPLAASGHEDGTIRVWDLHMD
jgi:hypothetical protein